MIPLTFLYDEYIDRPKLTEQKKPFEYIVPPPPPNGVGTITYRFVTGMLDKFSSVNSPV